MLPGFSCAGTLGARQNINREHAAQQGRPAPGARTALRLYALSTWRIGNTNAPPAARPARPGSGLRGQLQPDTRDCPLEEREGERGPGDRLGGPSHRPSRRGRSQGTGRGLRLRGRGRRRRVVGGNVERGTGSWGYVSAAGAGGAGPGASVESERPRWARMVRAPAGSWMVAMTRSRPPQRGQARGWRSNTRCINAAQVQAWVGPAARGRAASSRAVPSGAGRP